MHKTLWLALCLWLFQNVFICIRVSNQLTSQVSSVQKTGKVVVQLPMSAEMAVLRMDGPVVCQNAVLQEKVVRISTVAVVSFYSTVA